MIATGGTGGHVFPAYSLANYLKNKNFSIKLTSDNSGYTSNTVEIFAKLDAAVGTAVVITVKMVSTDGDNDDTYTAGNTDGVPANPNEAPIMTMALIEVYPDDTQGLAADIRSASNAEVSNSTS